MYILYRPIFCDELAAECVVSPLDPSHDVTRSNSIHESFRPISGQEVVEIVFPRPFISLDKMCPDDPSTNNRVKVNENSSFAISQF